MRGEAWKDGILENEEVERRTKVSPVVNRLVASKKHPQRVTKMSANLPLFRASYWVHTWKSCSKKKGGNIEALY